MDPKIVFFVLLFIFTKANSDDVREEYKVNFRSAFDKDLYESVLDTEQCQEQLMFLSNNSLGLQFLDASAKIPSGILTGNLNDLGDYFQCLGINQIIEDMDIQGKYCAITIPLQQDPIQIPEFPEWPELPEWPDWPDFPWPQPDNETVGVLERYSRLRRIGYEISGLGEPAETRIFPVANTMQFGMTMGVCVPRVCSPRQAIEYIQEQIPFLNVTFREYFCRLPNDKLFSAADYVAVVMFSLIAVLILISTSYDLHHIFVLKRDPSQANSLYRCFSIYTNTRRYLTFNTVPGALECVDGIRAISMMWVVVGHTYCLTLLGYIHNLRDTMDWLNKFSTTWINSAPITVDTFFALSGILAVYATVGKISKARFIRTVHLFYLNRLLRMFPLLATVVLLQASVFNHVSDGPFWQNVAQATENCRTFWWAALLHVQNYVSRNEICLSQSWYLSVDMQLYIVCPLVIVWLFDRRIIAWSSLLFFVLISLIASTTYSFVYNFSAALANMSRFSEFTAYVTTYYMNTLPRAAPFFVGMVYGYLLHLYRNTKLHISKLNVTLLWILSISLMAFCVFSIYPVMQPDHDAQIFDNLLNSYMRAIWACALGWLIFACVHGYGGPINWFLSLQMWKLPARLSYAMYLIHFPIIMVSHGSWVKTHYFSDGEAMHRFMGDITLTVIAAFVLCICIDAPFSTLQKLMLNGGGKKPSKPPITEPESQPGIVENGQYIKTSL